MLYQCQKTFHVPSKDDIKLLSPFQIDVGKYVMKPYDYRSKSAAFALIVKQTKLSDVSYCLRYYPTPLKILGHTYFLFRIITVFFSYLPYLVAPNMTDV